ncbi:MAG: hypothetical protein JWQ65_1099 [Devosia sp.]|nr:hypothetical protein [Devosia sp.]
MRFFAVTLAFVALTFPALAGDLTPDLIRAMLAKESPTAVVQSLDDGDAENNPWFSVLDRIETGDQDWIDLVPLLAPGTDAGTAEGLVITLSRTLKTNAPAVFKLIADGQFTVEDICVDNDIEVPLTDYIAFLDNIVVTVAAVLDPALLDVRNACLHQIGTARISALVDGH